MINDSIELLIDDIEIEESVAAIGASLLAYGAVSAGAPLAVGYGILAAPVVYGLYKIYKNYQKQLKEAKDEATKKKIRVQMKEAKLKFEKAKEQEIAKRQAKKKAA